MNDPTNNDIMKNRRLLFHRNEFDTLMREPDTNGDQWIANIDGVHRRAGVQHEKTNLLLRN